MKSELDTSERMVFALLASGIACIAIAVFCGALSVLFYFPSAATFLNGIGLQFQSLRPLHTSFASAWIFLGGIACVHKFLFDETGPPTDADRRRFRFQMVAWGIAGAGILFSVLLGLRSGREYIGFHPIFSIPIVAGWVAFAWTFFSRVARGFWSRPVYVYMWGVGIIYFLYTFAEGHAWLLPNVFHRPVVDLQIQWKSCGTIVASFNMLVYGTLMYLGERMTGDKTYARSSKGFILMGIGMLNSFTNYAHHTYHLPQAAIIKWISFGVSMLEIIILVMVIRDVRAAIAARSPVDRYRPSVHFVILAKGWTMALLFLALLISLPPLNSVIHGTRVVMAHAMGSEIGIDSFVLLAFAAWIFEATFARCWPTQEFLSSPRVGSLLERLNLSLAGLVLWLVIDGITVGVTRAQGLPRPEWLVRIGPAALAVLGLVHGYLLVSLVVIFGGLLRHPSRRRVLEIDRAPPLPESPAERLTIRR